MVAGMERRTLLVLSTLALALLAGSAPVAATAPEPVIIVEGPPAPAPDDGTEPYRDDRSGRCPAGDSRSSPGGELDLTGSAELTGAPGPVIAVEPLAPTTGPCLSDISLWLEVEAPNDKKPEGANGSLDQIQVPRSALEGGFEVTLPAQDRLITLQDPGQNWELKSTTCSCSGWTSSTASGNAPLALLPGVATSYPGPVIAVPPPPTGGPGGCSGASGFGTTSFMSSPALEASGVPSRVAAFPGPVIAVDPLGGRQAPRVDWDADGTVTITDPDEVGGTFTCIWTVELVYGRLDLQTVTKPSGEEGRFSYDVVPTGGQPDASALTMRGGDSERLRWGAWAVNIRELPEGWKVKRSSCSESIGELISLASGPSATVGLDPDDAVSCRFELELLAPKPGSWRTNNKEGTSVCSSRGLSISFDLAQAIDFGRMRVLDEGDRLVVRGGTTSYTFRRDRDDPLRYRATKRFRQAGYTLDFDIRLDLRSETRMTGTVRAKAKGRGSTCTIQRPVTLTHASAN
jgi:hypothetical protein